MKPSRHFLECAKKFIYRNARPLDFARWKFHFENGSAQDVLEILAAYQNPDGGFAHAIEPDLWNIVSTPAGVWAAAEILREIGFSDASHPVIQGMLRYLASGKDFQNNRWQFSVPSNRCYPHAAWWDYGSGGAPATDPTPSLAGFVLKNAEKDGELYCRARGIAVKAVFEYLVNRPKDAQMLRCYLELLGDVEDVPEFEAFDMKFFRQKLYGDVRNFAENNGTQCVKPSQFFESGRRVFHIFDRADCVKEAEAMQAAQCSDGSLPVSGQWWTEYKQAEIAENWWKSSMLISALLYVIAI